MFLCPSLDPGEVPPVVSMEDLLDSVPEGLRDQHPQPEVTVVVYHHLQLVLHQNGEVDPVLMEWLDQWYTLL